MKLWILKPQDNLPVDSSNPWVPWYDKTFGLIIRAETEEKAREMASGSISDVDVGTYTDDWSFVCTLKPWSDKRYSSCSELGPNGEEGIIMRDFAAA